MAILAMIGVSQTSNSRANYHCSTYLVLNSLKPDIAWSNLVTTALICADCGKVEAAAGDRTLPPPTIGHGMMSRGGWSVAMGPEGELQPPFTSSSWFDCVIRRILTFAKISQPTTNA
eukprot:scaffold34890_cov54-Cyclotella_meneghiniana.AAC.5